jgi:hypothetical protein
MLWTIMRPRTWGGVHDSRKIQMLPQLGSDKGITRAQLPDIAIQEPYEWQQHSLVTMPRSVLQLTERRSAQHC